MKCNIFCDYCTYGSILLWISHYWKKIGKAIFEWNVNYLYSQYWIVQWEFSDKGRFIYLFSFHKSVSKEAWHHLFHESLRKPNKSIGFSFTRNWLIMWLNSQIWRYHSLLITLKPSAIDICYVSTSYALIINKTNFSKFLYEIT